MFFIFFIVLAAGFLFLGNRKTGYETAKIEIRGTVIEAEIADTLRKRTQGLSGRPGLAENKGMLFIFKIPYKYGFWMKDMNFPIDIIWINSDKIVDFAENVQPSAGDSLPIFRPSAAADKVLELSAGSVERLNIKVGDVAALPDF